MSWLAWRQQRFEARLIAAATAAIAVLLVIEYEAATHGGLVGWAGVLGYQLFSVMLPALLGMFVGAPLIASEVERGTHRLAWAQSVSRRRWLLIRLGVTFSVSLAAMAAVGLLMYAALQPGLASLGAATGPSVGGSGGTSEMQPGWFDIVGIVPMAYTAFALALGAAAGALTRRTLISMLVVVVAFTAVRVSEAVWLRPSYEPPIRVETAFSDDPNQISMPPVPSGAWVVQSGTLAPDGHPVNGFHCLPDGPQACTRFHLYEDYQLANRFWRFQLTETALYLGLAAVLLSLTWVAVRRIR